jgi:hypothetical protein
MIPPGIERIRPLPPKQPLLEEDKIPSPSKDLATDPAMSDAAPIPVSAAASMQRAMQAPRRLTIQNIQQLQRAAGNQAVSQLLNRTGTTPVGGIQRLYVKGSDHYDTDRDAAHADAKTALEAADTDLTISYKIYNKHKKAKHGGKCVTTFKTSNGGFLITVTYADFTKDKERLTYDTAFLSKTVASKPESSAITYNPDSPTITVT